MRSQIGHYTILERVGAGNLGDVFRARDTRLGRTVAIKVATRTIPEELRVSLLDDARAAMAVSHPHAVSLFDAGCDENGNPFLVFEFVPGSPLRGIVHGQPLNPRHAVDLAIQISDALSEAHALGLRHLALTPEAVFVTPKGAAKVLDLGLSRWQRGLPSPAYLAPEQLKGEAGDHRADVFAVGVILYEMLTGRAPFGGSTPADISRAVLEDVPKPPSQARKEVPRELDPIVMRALAKRLENRYQEAVTLAAALRNVAVTAAAPSAVVPRFAGPAAPRSRAVTLMIWILVLLGVAAAIWLFAGSVVATTDDIAEPIHVDVAA